MERLEIAILARLGIADPYARRGDGRIIDGTTMTPIIRHPR